MQRYHKTFLLSIILLCAGMVTLSAQNAETVVFPSSGGTDTVEVQFSFAWDIIKTPEWCSATKLDEHSVAISAKSARTTAQREGNVVIGSLRGNMVRIHILQDGKANYVNVSFNVNPRNSRIAIPELDLEGSSESSYLIKEGNWTVLVWKDGCDTAQLTLEVPKSDRTPIKVNADLSRKYCLAVLSCSPSNDQLQFPEAPVFMIDGKKVDANSTEPHSFDEAGPVRYYELYDGNVLPVPAGLHTVEVSVDGFIPKTMDFYAEPNVLSNVDFRLQARTGSLTITDGGDAFYAAVFVDGVNFANVPFREETILAGDHVITFSKDGYAASPKELKVSISEGGHYEYEIKMVPCDIVTADPSVPVVEDISADTAASSALAASLAESSAAADLQLTGKGGGNHLPDGALGGVFSVSDDSKVYFSRGNLQAKYDGHHYTWNFAPNQYDCLGNVEGNTSIARQKSGNVVDLFGWSTAATNYGISTSQQQSQYGGEFKDWGETIDGCGTWRTLTFSEWNYLISGRTVTVKSYHMAPYGMCRVEGVNGIIILPDDWDGSLCEGFYYGKSDFINVFSSQSTPSWSAMEAAGCVFLPAAGFRNGPVINTFGVVGYYWSSTLREEDYPRDLYFGSGYIYPSNYRSRHLGLSVRMVTSAGSAASDDADRLPVQKTTEKTSENEVGNDTDTGYRSALYAKKTKKEVRKSKDSRSGSLSGHGYVDLGLPSGLLWATCNIGASSPSDYGSYFAWGETRPKSNYGYDVKYNSGKDSSLRSRFSKYCTDGRYGTVDNKARLESSDDAARVNWGGRWRMPTVDEWKELDNYCIWTWTSLDGHGGYKVTSKNNGNSIFLPAAGCRSHSDLDYAGEGGYYWSSSLNLDTPYCAHQCCWHYSDVFNSTGFNRRFYGNSVRPVYSPY